MRTARTDPSRIMERSVCFRMIFRKTGARFRNLGLLGARISAPLRRGRRRTGQSERIQSPSAGQSIEFSLNPAEGFVERIARAAHRADGILFRLLRQCLAQSADMNVDGALVDFRRKSPNAVEQLRARKDPAR